MAIAINGSGTITGVSAGGLPDNTVDNGTMADNAIDSAELAAGAVDLAHLSASGSASSSTYLRGDNSWAAVSKRTQPFRNLIINGAMQVAQRGTSFADPTDNAFCLDRWRTRNSSGDPAFTWTQDSEAPHGFASSLKCDCTTADTSLAAGDFHRLEYHFEGQDLQSIAKGTASAKKTVLSFYVKTDKTGVYTVNFYDNDNAEYFAASYTVGDTNWNRYTISVPADTSGAYDNDTAQSLNISWGLSIGSSRNSGDVNDLPATWGGGGATGQYAGQVNFADSTSNNWYITGVQYEIDHDDSGTATEYEHKSFNAELLACRRYCQKFTVPNSNSYRATNITATVHGGGDAVYVNIAFAPMRAAPSLTVAGTFKGNVFSGSWTQDTLSSWTADFSTDATSTLGFHGISYATISSSRTVGLTGQIFSNGTAASLTFDAEI